MKGYDAKDMDMVLARFPRPARSPVFAGVEGRVVGAFDIADSIRPDARETVAKLEAMGIHPVMVTGDTEAVAAEVSGELGGIDYLARRSPIDKVEVVRQYKEGEKGRVLMVGDGFNDSAALAAADVGVATAASIDISKDVADVVLVSSNLGGLISMIENSRMVARASASNVLLALAFNLVGIPLAMLGILSALYAMLIMVLSLFGVFANAQITKSRLGARLASLRSGRAQLTRALR
jgi:P-type E1-E2 ATPase